MNAAILTLLAVLYIPQSNDATLNESPLAQGEAAFIKRGDSEATLNVGGAEVIDRSALRGYYEATLSRDEYVVMVTGGFTYDGENDQWTLATTGGSVLTNTVTIRAANVNLYDTSATFEYRPGVGILQPESSRIIVGNTATYTVIWPSNTANAVISGATATHVAYGNADYTTDLTTHHIPVADTIGSLELGKWRAWARDLYNGNRGADWSDYPATHTVMMENQYIAFDPKAHYTIGVNSATNVVMNVGGYKAIEISHHGTTIETNMALRITSFATTNLTCYIGYVHDIASFDLTKLTVMETYSLTKPIVWSEVSSSDLEVKTDGLIVVKPITGLSQRFLKLVYNGSIETEVVTITLSGYVNIVGDLAINNTNLVAWMATVKPTLPTYDFEHGTNFTLRLYETLTNVIYALGGSVTNAPSFDQ